MRCFEWERFSSVEFGVFDSVTLRDCLIANFSNTLERFTLHSGPVRIPLDTLQGLTRLSELHVDIAFLFNSDGSNIHTWPSRLPPNLQKLSMKFEENQHKWAPERSRANHVIQIPKTFHEAFRCFLRYNQTPQLKNIMILMDSATQYIECYNHIQYPVSRAGIALRHSYRNEREEMEAGHMAPGCGECQSCRTVVDNFLCGSEDPTTRS